MVPEQKPLGRLPSPQLRLPVTTASFVCSRLQGNRGGPVAAHAAAIGKAPSATCDIG